MRLLAFAALAMFSSAAHADAVPFDGNRWQIIAKESRIEDHAGRKSLFLRAGLAAVNDSRFLDGVIEFDISFTGERGFMGVAWRMQEDGQNYEEFYLRPHQSGNPDANQYQPVFNGMEAWQLHYGERYSAPTRYRLSEWIHVKIVVAGRSAEVYIDDPETPALYIEELEHGLGSGAVALTVGPFAPAWYANFRFEPMDRPPELRGKPRPSQPLPPGIVGSWLVSGAFDGKTLDGKPRLTAADKRGLAWTRVTAETSGVANLGRVQGARPGHDTAFARLVVRSDREQVKRLRFGFSDAVRVYLNDRLLYGGSDGYRSRDYRFLGTIGLFDELYLPLVKGENSIWLAVTEDFGGWGVIAQIDDPSGITIVP